MLHLQTLTPLILLSVNVGPPRENLPFEYAIKGRKIEEAYKVSHKKPRKIFAVEELSWCRNLLTPSLTVKQVK